MTLLWIEGFEMERAREYHEDSYAIYDGPSTPVFIAGQNSLWAWKSQASGGTYLTTKTLGAHATYVMGVRLQVGWNAVPSTNYDLIGFNYSGSRHVSLGIEEIDNSTYRYIASVGETGGSTPVGTSANFTGGSGWDYIEMKVFCDALTGTIEIRRNGTAIITVPAGDTSVGGTSLINEVIFGMTDAGSYDMAMDDIYILNAAGPTCNDFLGEQIVEGIETNGIGSSTEWAPETEGQPSTDDNWELVNEGEEGTTPSRDDVAYVASGTPGERDFYEFDDLQQITSGITGIRYMVRARIETNGSHVVELQFQNAGTAAIGDFTVDSNHTIYRHFSVLSDINPVTSSPYTAAEINNAEIGIHLDS